jgi:hypothetical protein
MSDDFADPILGALINTISDSEHPEAGLGVTLMFPFGVIAGKIISGEQWTREVGELYKAADGEDSAVGGYLHMLAADASTEKGEWKKVDEVAEQLPREYRNAVLNARAQLTFVHLRDARVLIGGHGIPKNGMHWRGRISEVSGFTLGVLGPDSSGD